MKEDKDYKIHDYETDIRKDTNPVEILTGEYAGALFRYGRVKAEASEDGETANIKFEYNILPKSKIDHFFLQGNPKFERVVGEILEDIMLGEFADD